MAFGNDDVELALEWAHKAIELSPENVYKYNLSLIYEQRGLLDLAESAIMEAIGEDVNDADPDYIEQAYDIYVKRGKKAEAARMLAVIEDKDPDRAGVMRLLHSLNPD